MDIYKYILSYIIILRQHASITPVTINMLSLNKNTISTQTTEQ